MTDQRDTFDAVAAEYDAVRPIYPKALFDDLATVVGGAGQRVLEVGCGSGQATGGFVDRRWDVEAVDPGAELVALAKAKFPERARFHVAQFEAFEPEPAAFRLIASAQAWHWIDPAISFPKAASALQPDGWLAVFGHVPMSPPAEILQRLEPVYAQIAPDLWRPPPQAWYLPQGPVSSLFDASGHFEPVVHKAYAWSERASPSTFVQGLRTRSDHNVLPVSQREALLDAVEKALAPIEAFQIQNETHLYRARLKQT